MKQPFGFYAGNCCVSEDGSFCRKLRSTSSWSKVEQYPPVTVTNCITKPPQQLTIMCRTYHLYTETRESIVRTKIKRV